jgi:tetratricopeptide (TPR) repeat protein
MNLRRFSVVLAGVWVLASSGELDARPRRPDPQTTRARALFERAEVHFNVGEFEKALDLYSRAYKTKQLPAFLFNIAQCHRYLEQWERALFFYNRYLSLRPNSPHRAMVERFIEQCKRARQEAEQQAASQPVEPIAPASQPVEQPAAPPAVTVEETARPAAREKPSAAWVWTGVGVSAALLVGGTVTALIVNSQNQEYKDPETSVDRRLELRDTGKPLGVAAEVMLGVGGAAAVGTAIYYFVYYRPAKTRAERPAVSIAPLPTGGVALGGSF